VKPVDPNWGVFETDSDGVHVAPAEGDEVSAGHELSPSCWCHPKPLRDGPLDDPVWSHNEPGSPGAEQGMLA
jgi:hypothetical protein